MVSYNHTIAQEDLDALVDIAVHSRDNMKKMLVVRVVFAVLGGILVALLGRAAQRGDTSWLLAALALALVVYLIGPGTERMWRVRAKAGLGDEAKNLIGKNIRYVFSPAGVQITSNKGKGSVPWSDYTGWGTYEHYLYLVHKKGGYLGGDTDRLNKASRPKLVELIGKAGLPELTA